MKNTELVKLKGIMKYKEELNKVKPLTQDIYTVAEAAKYFSCAKSQIKGYHTNYKEVFGDTITVEGTQGKQRTLISKDGMFLMSILLSKKSKVAEEAFNRVKELVFNKEENAEQISMDEIASTKEKIATDNILNFSDLKAKKEKKKKEELVEITEIELTEEGPRAVTKKITREELEKRNEESKKRLASFFENIFSNIQENEEEGYYEEDEECDCPDCLENELNKYIHKSNLERLSLKHTLDGQITVTKSYKEICSILGIDDLTASIMIQKYILDTEKDIDMMILNHLVEQKIEEKERKEGSLYYSMELLTIEKFNENKEDAYIHLVNELKYIIGRDLSMYVIEHEYERLISKIVKLNAYEDAQKVIFTLLSE